MADKSLIDSKKAKMGLIGGAISGTITGLIVAWLTAQGIDPTEAAKVALAVSGTFLTPILAAITGQAFQDAAREKANGKVPIVKPGDPLTRTGAD